MATDERNFRSSYYEKVGCYSVEEKKSLNKLLQDDNIRNRSILKKFCLSYTVPAAQRSLLWGLIMGIYPLHKSSTDYIREQLRQTYEDLSHYNVFFGEPCKTKEAKMHRMWLLDTNRLLHNNAAAHDDNLFIDIVHALLQIFDDDVEIYWIAKEFYQYTRELKRECPKLKELTQVLLKREDISLFQHLEKLGIFDSNSKLLENLYTSCFAGIICQTVLVKIWDKVCGGSRKIVVFIFVELVKSLSIRQVILTCNTQDELKALIETVKDLDAVIVNKAIKTWQSSNCEIEYVH